MSFQEDKYPMEIILGTLYAMLLTKQKDKESLSNFTKCFKVSIDVLKAHIGGPLILTKCVKTLANYSTLALQVAEIQLFYH